MTNSTIKSIFLGLCFIVALGVHAQSKPAYKIYTSKGKKISYAKMVKKLASHDMVFFGELHNNAIAHWLELEITKDLITKRDLVLGAEMYERDNQEALNFFLNGTYSYKQLDSAARLWPNNKTDYAPLVDFAKTNSLNFVATNIPRRNASLVYKGGFAALDTLSYLEKTWIAPLPILFDSTLPTYIAILKMMGDHGSMDLVRAQAIKDATMAYSIYSNWQKNKLFLHYNGSYHSNYKEGIIWYLLQTNPDLKIGNIAVVSQDDLNQLNPENKGIADYIICVDSDMTNTY